MRSSPDVPTAADIDIDIDSLVVAVRDTLCSRVGVGPVFLATADPGTGAFTGTFTFDIPDDAAAAFFAIETTGRDVVPFRELSRAARPVGSLFAATDDEPRASERWREVIEPLHWGDELRAAIRLHGSTWGYLCLHREAGERPFGPSERERVQRLLPGIAELLRRAALTSPTAADPGRAVVLVDPTGRITGTAGAADAWIDDLGSPDTTGLPLLVRELCRRVAESGRGTSRTVRTRSGRVANVDVAPLEQDGPPQLAVVIGAAAPEQRLPAFAAAGGLTAREREIVTCVLAGLSTRAIADEFTISPYTVQAHLTSVFAKTGLRSRRELVSRLSR